MKKRAMKEISNLFVLVTVLCVLPSVGRTATIAVNCDAGEKIQSKLDSAKPRDTLVVSGTCKESILIPSELSRITLDGRGSATIRSGDSLTSVVVIWGQVITVRGFTITGGRQGIAVVRGGMAVIDGNTIQNTGGDGIRVESQGYVATINNTIQQNRVGIVVQENSHARIGFVNAGAVGLPNTIQNNTGHGIVVARSSSARITSATISNNGGDGIRVERISHADIANNTIQGNNGNGVTVTGNSGVDLEAILQTAQPNRTDVGRANVGFGIACSLGAYVSGNPGTLMGAKGAKEISGGCIDNLKP